MFNHFTAFAILWYLNKIFVEKLIWTFRNISIHQNIVILLNVDFTRDVKTKKQEMKKGIGPTLAVEGYRLKAEKNKCPDIIWETCSNTSLD